MPLVRPAAIATALLAGALALAATDDAGAAPAKRRKATAAKVDARAAKKRLAPRSTPKAKTGPKGSARPRAQPRTSRVKASRRAGTLPLIDRAIACPHDMVAVAGRVCVDRFETSVVDAATGAAWSPFYTPDLERARRVAAFYDELRGRRSASSLASLVPVPPVPDALVAPRATSRAGATPQGYLSGEQADALCRAAGKRLCTESEWLTACRGEARRDFPYGARYEHGACNVWRESHPSALLHGNASRYHDDPRNGLVEVGGRTFLLPTGSSPRCASRWGDDAVFDMVGNLDEWVADPDGVFVGGFYARASRAGCYARVSNHARAYSDYSTGARCCADPSLPG
jgi:hypothetical protein